MVKDKNAYFKGIYVRLLIKSRYMNNTNIWWFESIHWEWIILKYGHIEIYISNDDSLDLSFLIISFTFRYEKQDIALNCGTMLRECIHYEALAKIILYSDEFYNFFRYVEVSTFDIASDAFSTFKVCIVSIYIPYVLYLIAVRIILY